MYWNDFILSLAITAGFGVFNPVYDFVPPIIITNEQIIAVQEHIEVETGETIRKVIAQYDPEMNLVFKTTALSAQNPIKVEADLDFLNLPDAPWNALDENYYLVFPFAVNIQKSEMDGKYYGAVIPIKKIEDSKKYYGEGEIKYPFEGEKLFFVLLTWSELEAHSNGVIAKIPESYIEKEMGKESLLRIEPSSTTTTLLTNNMIIALTFVVIAFGIMQFRISVWKNGN